MAPDAAQRGTKRGGAKQKQDSSLGETPKKRAVEEKGDLRITAVCSAIRDSALPDGCREMLCAAAPGVLSLSIDKRSKVHNMFARQIEHVLKDRSRTLENQIEAAAAKVAEIERSRDELKNARAGKQESVISCGELLQECKTKVDAQGGVVKEKSEALAAAQDAQRTGDATANKLKADAAIMIKARDHGLPAIKNDVDDAATRAPGLATLEPFWRLVDGDSCMLGMLPGVCKKRPSERSDFDNKMIEFVEESMTKLAAELPVKLQQEVPGVLERAKLVNATKAAFDEASQHERTLLEETDRAKISLAQAEMLVMQAQKAEEACEPAILAAKAEEEHAKTRLQTFLVTNIAGFESLRDDALKPQTSLETSDEISGSEAATCSDTKVEPAAVPNAMDISVGGA